MSSYMLTTKKALKKSEKEPYVSRVLKKLINVPYPKLFLTKKLYWGLLAVCLSFL